MSPKAAAGAALRSAVAGLMAPTDKRFRRPDSRPVRRRSLRLSRLWKPAAAVIAGLAVIGAAGGVLLSAPGLAVDRLVVRGHKRLSAADIEARLSGVRGSNILRVNLETYRARVLESPWVEHATLWRVLPSTIEVRVVERVPAVLARLGQQLYLMDANGVLLGEFGPAHRDLDLPIVDGLSMAYRRGDSAVDAARVQVTGRFLDALEARPDLRARVSQIDVANARDLVVLLEDDTASLHLGEDRFVERLTFYLEMLPTLGDEFQDIDYVDLRFEGRLFVRSRGHLMSAATGGDPGKQGVRQEARR